MEDWQRTYQLQMWLDDYEERRVTFDALPEGDDISQRLGGNGYGSGLTLLQCLTMNGDCSGVKSLLERGADPNIVNLYGETALHVAVGSGNYVCCQHIISAGGKDLLNARTPEGETALHYAAKYRYSDSGIYELLIDCGADDNIQDEAGTTPRDIFKDEVISELYSVRKVKTHRYRCPFCQKTLQTWRIGKDGKELGSPSGYLITDGDTVSGVAEAVRWTEADPCYWALELARDCAACAKESFFVVANFMSKKYSGEKYESRLCFNTDVGMPEYFKVNFDALAMKRIDGMSFNTKPEDRPKFRVPYWHDMEFNGGCWHFTEYKSDTLPPMQAHRIGPFKIADIENIQGPYGVSVCTGGGTEWDYAKDLLISLFPYFQNIADKREECWQKNQTRST